MKSKFLQKYVRKNPIKSAILLFFGILSCLFIGIDDQESIDLYIQKLQTLSEHKILIEQTTSLKNFYLRNDNKHPEKEHKHQIRKEFNQKKPLLKKEWESKYKMIWPTLILTKKGIVKKFSFEAHHIIPINAGGINRWWNITPLSPRNHKLLHSSIEEKACFSHDFFEQKYYRFILKIRIMYQNGIKDIKPKLKKLKEMPS